MGSRTCQKAGEHRQLQPCPSPIYRVVSYGERIESFIYLNSSIWGMANPSQEGKQSNEVDTMSRAIMVKKQGNGFCVLFESGLVLRYDVQYFNHADGY